MHPQVFWLIMPQGSPDSPQAFSFPGAETQWIGPLEQRS